MTIDISQLPMPQVSSSGVQLLDLLSAAEPDFKKLEQIVSQDPTLASSVIKYANSPLFHRQSKISNVQAALGLLGLKNIRSAVVMAIMRSVNEKQKNPIDDVIWEHSQRISLLCRHIARVCAPALADDMQFIGLIHDIGMLVLNHFDAEHYKKLIAQAKSATQTDKDKNLDVLEFQFFGLTHDVVSVRVCDSFRIMEQVSLVIGVYHNRDGVDALDTEIDRMAGMLSLAHYLELQITDEERCFASSNPFDFDKVIGLLRLDESLISKIVADCQALALE